MTKDIAVHFPSLNAAECAALARELEQEFLAAGVPAGALKVVRNDTEAMDFGGALIFLGGILGWEFIRSNVQGAGAEIGKLAGRQFRMKFTGKCAGHGGALEIIVLYQ